MPHELLSAPGDVYEAFVDSQGKAILVPCAVLYVDVLGIEALSGAPDREKILRDLLTALETARAEAMVESNEAWQALTWFTDNVVAAFPILPGHIDEEPALGSALRAATYIQLRLVTSDFLVRGGVAFGEIHMAPRVAFGPALIEAVRLEKQASTPRVLLSAHAVALQKKAMLNYGDEAPQELEMAVDLDGKVFVDYLNYWRAEEDDDSVFSALIRRHRERIESGLAAHAVGSAVHAKYAWLAGYHNWVVGSWPDGAPFIIPGQGSGVLRRASRGVI